MIQGVCSHQLLKTWQQLQKFRISGQRPSRNSKDHLHSKQEMIPHIPQEDLGKKTSAKSVSQTQG